MGDFASISVTAKLSAYYRRFSDIAFASEVATLIGAEAAFTQLVEDHALAIASSSLPTRRCSRPATRASAS